MEQINKRLYECNFTPKKNDLFELFNLQRRDKCMHAFIHVAMMKEKKRMCKPEKFAILYLKFRSKLVCIDE